MKPSLSYDILFEINPLSIQIRYSSSSELIFANTEYQQTCSKFWPWPFEIQCSIYRDAIDAYDATGNT